MLFPAVPAEMPFPVETDIDGTLSRTDPVLNDPVVVRLPADPTVFDTGSVVDMAVMEEVCPAVPDVVTSSAVVAMVGVAAVHIGENMPMECDADSDMCDPRNDFETVDGMLVYHGGDFNDSDCEDPHDMAYEDWVDWYNLNVPEGCCVDLPDNWEDRLPNAMDSAVNDSRRGGSAGACATGFVGNFGSGNGY